MSGRFSKVYSGYEDVYITGSPSFTFFSQVYTGKSKYETYCLDTNASVNCDYGSTIRVTIPTKGDILKALYLKVFVPTSNISFYAGYQIMDYADLVIGGQLIERLTSEYMYNYINMMSTKGEFLSLSYTTQTFRNIIYKDQGDLYSPNFITSPAYSSLFVPLPFYFYKKEHLAIPLCALKHHPVEVYIKLRDWTQLSNNNQAYNVSKLQLASVPVEYSLVSEDIRSHLVNSELTYCINQVQMQPHYIEAGDTLLTTQLSFVNPIQSINFQFFDYYDIKIGKRYIGGPDFNWVDFSDVRIISLLNKYGNSISRSYYAPGVGDYYYNTHHFENMELRFNDEIYIDPEVDGNFLYSSRVNRNKDIMNTPIETKDPLDIFQYSPDINYIYNFGKSVITANPSGQINFSRIRDKLLKINLVPSINDRFLRIFARSSNILKISGGIAGLKYMCPVNYNWDAHGFSTISKNLTVTVAPTVPPVPLIWDISSNVTIVQQSVITAPVASGRQCFALDITNDGNKIYQNANANPPTTQNYIVGRTIDTSWDISTASATLLNFSSGQGTNYTQNALSFQQVTNANVYQVSTNYSTNISTIRKWVLPTPRSFAGANNQSNKAFFATSAVKLCDICMTQPVTFATSFTTSSVYYFNTEPFSAFTTGSVQTKIVNSAFTSGIAGIDVHLNGQVMMLLGNGAVGSEFPMSRHALSTPWDITTAQTSGFMSITSLRDYLPSAYRSKCLLRSIRVSKEQDYGRYLYVSDIGNNLIWQFKLY